MSSSKDTIVSLYDAFGRGDVPAVLGMFDPAIEWNEADNFPYAGGNPYRGPEGVLNGVFIPITGDVEGFSVTAEHYIADGDTVAVEGRYRGTWKATGTPVDAQFVHVWRLRNGKVIQFQQYTDTLQWARAAGK